MTGKPWYSPTSFMPDEGTAKFGANQIDWICEHYEVLIDGRWPQKSSGYIDNPFAPPAQGVSSKAYFETPMQVLSEFHKRIMKCGYDGDVFVCIKCLKYDEIRIRRVMRIDSRELERILKRVFAYIVGRAKRRTYYEFIRH